MPYDKAEVNFQSGPKTDPDANEDWDVQGKGPVPFGGSNSRHWIVLIRCEDVLDRILLKQSERGAHNLSKPIAVCSVVGRHLGCPRCTVIGTQCV